MRFMVGFSSLIPDNPVHPLNLLPASVLRKHYGFFFFRRTLFLHLCFLSGLAIKRSVFCQLIDGPLKSRRSKFDFLLSRWKSKPSPRYRSGCFVSLFFFFFCFCFPFFPFFKKFSTHFYALCCYRPVKVAWASLDFRKHPAFSRVKIETIVGKRAESKPF